MFFRATQKTLEGLEWPRIVDRLREGCRTPQARRLIDERVPGASIESELGATEGAESLAGAQRTGNFVDEFAGTLVEVRTRLGETSEARCLLETDGMPPLSGVGDLESCFQRAVKGGAMTPQQLLEVCATLAALRETRRFVASHAERAPLLIPVRRQSSYALVVLEGPGKVVLFRETVAALEQHVFEVENFLDGAP